MRDNYPSCLFRCLYPKYLQKPKEAPSESLEITVFSDMKKTASAVLSVCLQNHLLVA
jgi:hypothetical protein